MVALENEERLQEYSRNFVEVVPSQLGTNALVVITSLSRLVWVNICDPTILMVGANKFITTTLALPFPQRLMKLHSVIVNV